MFFIFFLLVLYPRLEMPSNNNMSGVRLSSLILKRWTEIKIVECKGSPTGAPDNYTMCPMFEKRG